MLNDRISLAILVAAVAFFGWDISVDILSGDENYWHLFVEASVFLASAVLLVAQLWRIAKMGRVLSIERDKTARLSGELFNLIQRRFVDWQLTTAERDVALLLIKGYTMREIGELRSVKEKTARQQAASIYQKSGCATRHELAALFIQDLLENPGP